MTVDTHLKVIDSLIDLGYRVLLAFDLSENALDLARLVDYLVFSLLSEPLFLVLHQAECALVIGHD